MLLGGGEISEGEATVSVAAPLGVIRVFMREGNTLG
jgi:alpha-glucosidase (family GH31 glycosyl hydrolase)